MAKKREVNYFKEISSDEELEKFLNQQGLLGKARWRWRWHTQTQNFVAGRRDFGRSETSAVFRANVFKNEKSHETCLL